MDLRSKNKKVNNRIDLDILISRYVGAYGY